MKLVVIIPNWNGLDFIANCLDSMAKQTAEHTLLVVDNGSTDGSKELINEQYPHIHLIERDRNYGFTGGVNPGLEYAIEHAFDYAVLFNNDAVANPDWLEQLVAEIERDDQVGIVTSKIRHLSDNRLDSTADLYSDWGLPYPRGRDEVDNGQYDGENMREIFGASGGASLYRVSMLREIGLFDEHFFAYFEDIDISFRAQLAGWRVRYQPLAVVRHMIGGTSSLHKGFGRYHTVKNFHYIYVKNMPARLYWKYFPKYAFMIFLMFGSDLKRGLWPENLRANGTAIRNLPTMLIARRQIQKDRKVSVRYIDSILYHKLPPTQRSFANLKRRLFGR